MKQYLKLKLSQKLSPQQIQLMKLIQLPTLDFEQKIQREIEENPALEQGQNSNDDDNQKYLITNWAPLKELTNFVFQFRQLNNANHTCFSGLTTEGGIDG